MIRDLEPCEICRGEFDPRELVEFGGMQLCPECLDTSTLVCERCGERIWREDNAGDRENALCQACFENHYVRCRCCNQIIRETDAYYGDDDTPLCHVCKNERSSRYAVQPYGYKPTPIFYGEEALYLGVELEMDSGGESDAKARALMGIANSGDARVYIKHNGSLDDGFEVVTQPMTLGYHLHHMPWAEMLEKTREMGYKSHQARTCGTHLHVNRNAFGHTEEEQEKVIARILFFVEKHLEELLKFSRWTQRQVEQ